MRAYTADCNGAIEKTGNWRREHSLEAEWAGAGDYGRAVISINGIIEDSKLVGWGGVGATGIFLVGTCIFRISVI